MQSAFHWDEESLPDAGADSSRSYSDCWGFFGGGREYAVIGSAKMTHFFDVTVPQASVEIGRFEGEAPTSWREYKSYNNKRIYGVTDFTEEGLYIWDVSGAPSEVKLVKQTKQFFKKCHMLFVDEKAGRLYCTGTDIQHDGVVVLDIATDPDNPILLAQIPFPLAGYAHDIHVRDNIVFGSHGYNGLYVWDFAIPTSPVLMANYDTNGYNHSSWLSPNGRYLVSAEEIPKGLPLLLFDMNGVFDNDLEIVSQTRAPLENPSDSMMIYHNPYFLSDQEVVVSCYEDGVHVYNIADPTAPKLAAYFDTYPENNGVYTGYKGCWGVYPFLPSGRLIASDMQHGLFVLDCPTPKEGEEVTFSVSPNPAADLVKVEVCEHHDGPCVLTLYDLLGHTLLTQSFDGHFWQFDVSILPAATYFINIRSGDSSTTQKIVVQRK